MVNNYWCDVSKISLVFYYLYNVKAVLAAVALRLKLLLSKCLQCNYIHTPMTQQCARKEKLETKMRVLIESGHLSLGVWRGKSAKVLHGAARRFLSKHNGKLLLVHKITHIVLSWLSLLQGGWASAAAGAPELLLTPTLTSAQNCTSPPDLHCWTSLEELGQHRQIPLGTCNSPPNYIHLMQYLCSVQRAPSDSQELSNAHYTVGFPSGSPTQLFPVQKHFTQTKAHRAFRRQQLFTCTNERGIN